jgi:hypothetical protein
MAAVATSPKTRSYWSDTRPNGAALEPGTLCWMTEIEGENPIPTYGRTVDEVLGKVSYTLGHAQAEIARRASAGGGNGTRTPTALLPAARTRMNANEVMQATSDLGNPAKAGDAVTRLVQDATGVDLKQMALEALETRCNEWMQANPDFYDHRGNRDLLMTHAMRAAGYDYASVSKETLSAQFHKLQQAGILFDAPAAPAAGSEAFPGGSPVQRVEYPRGGRPGTGTRSTSFRATQTTQPRTPKYSDDDIRKMPASKKRELIEKNDPDFAAACDRMYAAQAS